MEKYKIFVGMDISKSWIDVVILKEGQSMHRQFNNSKKDYKVMLSWLKNFAGINDMLLCMEHTGVYALPLWNYLAQHKVSYVVETGLQIKSSMGIKRGKSDIIDAGVIARYIKLHHTETRLHKVPDKIISRLKILYSYRARLLKVKHQLFVANKEITGFVDKSMRKEMSSETNGLVTIIEHRIDKIERIIRNVIAGDAETKRIYELIESVPGIGLVTAVYLIIITQNFTILNNSRKLANYAGVAPHEHSSGSSIKGKNQVSHLADKKLKALLSNGVKTNLQYDTETKEYAARKTAEKKHEGIIINNLKNKLLHRVCAVVQRGTKYVDIKKYAAKKKVA